MSPARNSLPGSELFPSRYFDDIVRALSDGDRRALDSLVDEAARRDGRFQVRCIELLADAHDRRALELAEALPIDSLQANSLISVGRALSNEWPDRALPYFVAVHTMVCHINIRLQAARGAAALGFYEPLTEVVVESLTRRVSPVDRTLAFGAIYHLAPRIRQAGGATWVRLQAEIARIDAGMLDASRQLRLERRQQRRSAQRMLSPRGGGSK